MMDFLTDKQSRKIIEDIVAVVDGRIELLDEIKFCSHDVRGFVCQSCRQLLADHRFMGYLPQLVPDDGRETVVEERLRILGTSGCRGSGRCRKSQPSTAPLKII